MKLKSLLFLTLLLSWAIIFSSDAQSQTLESGKKYPLKELLNRRKPVSVRTNPGTPFQFPLANPVVQAHRHCATDEYNRALQLRYPNRATVAQFEQAIAAEINRANKTSEDTVIYRIPVVVHVVHAANEAIGQGANISLAQIESQITVMNNDFRRKTGTPGFNNSPVGADARIEFFLAPIDPQGNRLAEPGVNRVVGDGAFTVELINERIKPRTQWDPERYLNMWTARFGPPNADLLGYAQFPSLSGLGGLDEDGGSARQDGVVMRFDAFGTVGTVSPGFDGGRTTTHEVGHFLGLRHIWGDETGCTGNDFCDDTPVAGQPNYDCQPLNSCTEPQNDRPDMIENYMDYSKDVCMNIFTIKQVERMRAVMRLSPRRKELIASGNRFARTSGTGAEPFAYFESDNQGRCAGATTVQFTADTLNKPTSFNWVFAGGTPETSTEQNPTVEYNEPGIFSVGLTVANANGADSIVRHDYISVLSTELADLPLNVDFEASPNLPNQWLIGDAENDGRTWKAIEGVSASGGNNAFVMDNFDRTADISGTIDIIATQPFDFTGVSNPELSFDVAYSSGMLDEADTLAIMATTNCGDSVEVLWLKGGQALNTALTPDGETAFSPQPNEWRKQTIYLSKFANVEGVHLFLVNISGWGNRLFLDNIVVNNPTVRNAPSAAMSVPIDTICVDELLTVYDASNDNPASWNWSVEGGELVSENERQFAIFYFDTPGLKTISLDVANSVGSDKAEVNVFVVAPPTLTVTPNSAVICDGDSVTLTAAGPDNIFWFSERDIFPIPGPAITVKPDAATGYVAAGFDVPACISYQLVEIAVNPRPTKPVIRVSGDSLAVTEPVEGISYTWKRDNDTTVGTGTSILASGNGNYTVEASNDCDTLVSDAAVYTSRKSAFEQLFALYPNPNNGTFTLQWKANAAQGYQRLSVQNMMGQTVYQTNIAPNSATHTIQLGSISAGIYLLQLSNGASTVVHKLVIE
jgi:PKD repeat protein